MKVKVGFGYDVHQLKAGRPCVIGGVHFDSHVGPDGHSDADVLLHAICDAILGAAGLRDIGYHFPNTAEAYKNIDSKILLKETMHLIQAKGFEVGNIDATIVAEIPKISPRIEEIKTAVASLLRIEMDDIGIKATTSEKMGFVGEERGIEAYAVVLLVNQS